MLNKKIESVKNEKKMEQPSDLKINVFGNLPKESLIVKICKKIGLQF